MRKADGILSDAMEEFAACDCYQEAEKELTRSKEKKKQTKKSLIQTETELKKSRGEIGNLNKAVANLRLESSKNKTELESTQE